MKRVLISLAASGLIACATGAETVMPQYPVDAVLSDLAGSWSNQAQYDAAPEDLKRPPAAAHPYDWLDLQYADFYRIEAPALGEHVVYLEWRRDDGEISRQRIWVFHENEDGRPGGMDFFTFRDAAPYAGRGAEPGAFSELSADDLIGYPDGCALQPDRLGDAGLRFTVAPEDCRITTRSGREMGIFAAIDVTPDAIRYSEAGILPDGGYAFLVPGGAAYEFRRVGE